MKKPKDFKRIFSRRFILFLAAFVCGLLVIGGLNEPHFFPFSTHAELSYPISLAVSDEGSAMIDSEGRRLLTLSTDGKVTAIVESTASGSPVDKYETVTISDGNIYLIGSSHYAQGVYLSTEAVLKYDMKGNYLETLTSRSYESEEYVNELSFTNIIGYQGNIYLTCAENKEVQVLRISDSEEPLAACSVPECIYSAAYSPAVDLIATIGMSKNCYAVDCGTGTESSMPLPDLIGTYLESNGIDPSRFDLNELADCYRIPGITFDSDGTAAYVACANPFNGKILAFTADGEELDCFCDCAYQLSLFLRNLFYYIALFALAAGGVYLLVCLFIRKFTTKIRLMVFIIGIIIFTSVFYTIQINNATEAEFSRNLVTMTKHDAYLISETYGGKLEKLQEEGVSEFCSDPANQDEIQNIRNKLKTLCDFNGDGSSCNTCVILLDKDGTPYSFVHSGNVLPSGKILSADDEIMAMYEGIGKGEVLTTTNSYETLLYCYENIYGADGRTLGYYAVSAYRSNIDYVLSQADFNLAIILVAIFIGIYVLFTACQSFKMDFKRRRLRDQSDVTGRTADMAGIMIFAISFVSSIDNVIIVYVSQSLCADADPSKQAFLVALPVAAVSAGQLVGTLIADSFIRRLGERTSAVLASILTAASMLVCVFAINNSNIFTFVIGVFGMNIFMCGIMFVHANTMPYKTKDKKEQESVLHSLLKCYMAASILSMLSAGFIAEYLSYSMIYLLGAILSASVLILSVIAFKNAPKRKDLSRKQRLEGSTGHWTIFLQKPMLIFILFYAVPGMLIGGYKAYLFPLYSSGCGISALLLSNISIFTQALTYATHNAMYSLAAKLKSKAVQLIPRFIQCFGLICFLISPNIYWAIAMLFVIDIMNNMTSVAAKMYLTDVSEKAALDTKRVQSNYYTVSSVLYTFQSPILSGIVSLGINIACAAVGLIAGGLYVAFGFLTKNNSKDNKNKN